VNGIDVIWSSRDYAATGKSILSNISFKFHNFEKVAVIGKVGCGKTTLFNALLREAFVQKGDVNIGGTDIISYVE